MKILSFLITLSLITLTVKCGSDSPRSSDEEASSNNEADANRSLSIPTEPTTSTESKFLKNCIEIWNKKVQNFPQNMTLEYHYSKTSSHKNTPRSKGDIVEEFKLINVITQSNDNQITTKKTVVSKPNMNILSIAESQEEVTELKKDFLLSCKKKLANSNTLLPPDTDILILREKLDEYLVNLTVQAGKYRTQYIKSKATFTSNNLNNLPPQSLKSGTTEVWSLEKGLAGIMIRTIHSIEMNTDNEITIKKELISMSKPEQE